MGLLKQYASSPDMGIEQLQRHFQKQVSQEDLTDLVELVNDLKKKVDAKEKKVLTKGAQMLLLYHLGLIETFKSFDAEAKQKGKLLGALLGINSEDAERDYLKIGSGKSKAYETKTNYDSLIDFLYDLGLREFAQKIEKEKKIAGEKGRI